MNVCVLGLWHLGCVSAAGLVKLGHSVVGLDFDSALVNELGCGRAPIFEPGLDELLQSGIGSGSLRFTDDIAVALSVDPEIIWVAYDTPVDSEDRADVEFVFERTLRLLERVPAGKLILVSSQLPVGSVRRFEEACPSLRFACSPENLRLGNAIDVFMHPDRVVLGVRRSEDRMLLSRLFDSFVDRLVWMSVESAEMTKHALNAFLATSVAFINEVAVICEHVGADAKDVERGLKSEIRIGPRAYLSPGNAFAGGTLARDIEFLSDLSKHFSLDSFLLNSVRCSNIAHKQWAKSRLTESLGGIDGRRIAVWGLAYKSGTSTLRQSASIELCVALHSAGATVQAYDPSVRELPPELAQKILLSATAEGALEHADALVVASNCSEFRELPADLVLTKLKGAVVLDGGRVCAGTLGEDPRIVYHSVGKSGI